MWRLSSVLRSAGAVVVPAHGPLAKYDRFVGSGVLKLDAPQRAAMVEVERCFGDVVAFQESSPPKRDVTVPAPRHMGLTPINAIRASELRKWRESTGEVSRIHPWSAVQGVYMHGCIGSGKTRLMDVFFDELPVTKKMRVHWHQFMLDVHWLVRDIPRNVPDMTQPEIFQQLAIRVCAGAEVMCFDDVRVESHADAALLLEVFHHMYKLGICALYTSDFAPDALYEGGAKRADVFDPWLALLKRKCYIHDMQSDKDYRLSGAETRTFLSPVTPATTAEFQTLFLELTARRIPREHTMKIYGRDIVLDKAVDGIVKLDFAALCRDGFGASDFECIARSFHTVFVHGVPQFAADDATDDKLRFASMMDTLHARNVKTIVHAAAEPELLVAPAAAEAELLGGGDGASSSEAGAVVVKAKPDASVVAASDAANDAMARCVETMRQMRDPEYLEALHRPEAVGFQFGMPPYEDDAGL
jgi:predicted ATPase